jgi:predicted nicotinamide N-methyase
MEAARVAPDIVSGRRVRLTAVQVSPDLCVRVLEAADVDTVLEESVQIAGGAYAAVLWPSAIAVATRLASIVRPGMHVLDLGAGTGIAALTASHLGARATAVDYDAFSRAVIAEAALLAGLDVAVSELDLRTTDPLPAADVVVMADLLYDPELARTAAERTLEAIRAGASVLIGDHDRFGRAEYSRALAEAGVEAEFQDTVVRVPGDAMTARVGVALITPDDAAAP